MLQKTGNNRTPQRTTSICERPENILLEYVHKNDCDGIKEIISKKSKLLDHIYISEAKKSILLIACSKETVKAKTIKTLIDLGADIHFPCKLLDHWNALHFAASRADSEILNTILNIIKDQGFINSTANGNNALHILLKYGKSKSTEEFIECARILINNGIDVNLGNKQDISPILWAAVEGYREIIKLVIDQSPVPVDLDSHRFGGKTARDIIEEKGLYDGILPKNIDIDSENVEDKLFHFIKNNEEIDFCKYNDGNISYIHEFRIFPFSRKKYNITQTVAEKELFRRSARNFLCFHKKDGTAMEYP